ncbi:hypothetical protein JXI42_10270 [bacterium]|nr:hypothetical protein [bacterium]
MKRITYLIVPLIILSSFQFLFAKSLKPDSYINKVILEGSKNNYIYYSFSNKKPVELKVTGPKRIKVYLRAYNDCRGTEFNILVDENVIQTDKMSKGLSKYKLKDTKENVSNAKTFNVKIPSGEHTLILKPFKKCISICRFVELEEELVLFAPTKTYRTLNLIVKEKGYDYYLCTKDEPVEVSIIGPTTITVYARLNYSKEMRGTQHFKIIVTENGESKYNYKLETNISEVSYYEEEKGLLPSKAEKFTIKVNKGSHKFKFYLGDSAANTAALRFFVPESALQK